jgi:Zn finger protein HypA/HybF involved in hydrogenase expression
MERKKIAKNLTKEILTENLNNSENWNKFIKLCGYKANNLKNRTQIIIKLDEFSINYNKLLETNITFKTYTTEEVFCKNSIYTGKLLRDRIIKDFNWPLECNICKLSEWMGKPINIEVDHINGINDDHSIENLQYVCGNCHAQTENYRAKNKKSTKVDKEDNKCIDCNIKISKSSLRCNPCMKLLQRKVLERPTLEQLEEDLKALPYTKVGLKYNVSDNTIRKWIKQYKAIIVSEEEKESD